MSNTTADFEKLGAFYLGRRYDMDAGEVGPEPVLLDSRDLTTHAAIIGMTGSGKTGLFLDAIEEAAIDGIPAICIDPKGDLANLFLTFPQLRGKDFAPGSIRGTPTGKDFPLRPMVIRSRRNGRRGWPPLGKTKTDQTTPRHGGARPLHTEEQRRHAAGSAGVASSTIQGRGSGRGVV